MLEHSLAEHLGADAGVSAIVGAAIFPPQIPQGQALPAITMRRAKTNRLSDISGTIGITIATVQVICWASTYPAAKSLADAVGDCLRDLTGAVGTTAPTTFEDCMQDDEEDLLLPPDDDSDEGTPHVPLQFTITFQE